MASRAMTTRKPPTADWRIGLRRSIRRAAQMTGAGVLLAAMVFLALALASLLRVPMTPGFLLTALAVAELLLVAGLAASFLHLGRKMRAWRAALMWRTSWMSREVIVLPAFIAPPPPGRAP